MKKFLTIIAIILFICVESSAQNRPVKPNSNTRIAYLGKTRPLSDIKPLPPSSDSEDLRKDACEYKGLTPAETGFTSDKSAQKYNGTEGSVMIVQNFSGISNINNGTVPDTEGDIGINHYIQMINRSFAVYNKQGNLLYGPANNHTVFNDFPGPWDDMLFTDPVVMYDHIADRWVLTNMAFDWGVDYYEMIAVSASSDPLGEWHCYAVQFENMPDYPKLGNWLDGYYLSVNEWEITPQGNAYFNGPTVMAFNREDMINGEPNVQFLEFHLDAPTQSHIQDIASFQPSDLDGALPPPGTPNHFICTKDDEWGFSEDRIYIYEFHSDWDNPGNSTFNETGILLPESFSSNFSHMDYIPQPDVETTLQSLCQFTMYRLQYRSFEDYQVMLFNHTVEVDGDSHAGVRWYELRKYENIWEIHQQGTYAPDAVCRWMGGIAMDGDGNIGLGYSVSGIETYPSVRITGRNYNNFPGIMTFSESTVINGGGSQQSNQRWGDYSMMGVDPVDDLTFWYTQQYIPTTGYATYKTRIVSFQLHKNLCFSTDSLCFLTLQECEEGKDLIIKNNSLYDVTINELENEGQCGEAIWFIEPWNISLPITLVKDDSLICTVKVNIPLTENTSSLVSDSLILNTEYKEHNTIICVDELLMTGSNFKEQTINSVQLKVYPNPFNNKTSILFELEKKSSVTLEIIDQHLRIINTLVLNKTLLSGKHKYSWDGTDQNGSIISSGVYFCRLSVNKKYIIQKIIK